MHVQIPNEYLTQFVNITSKVIKPNINIPLLRNILLDIQKDKIYVVGTDLEIQVRAYFETQNEKETKITVHSPTFSQYINSLDSQELLDLEIKEHKLIIKHNNSKTQFIIKPATEYPLLTAQQTKKVVSIRKDSLIQALEKTLFCASKDELRPILTGVHFNISKETLETVSTDTYRLSYTKTPLENKPKEPINFTAPARSLQHLLRILQNTALEEFIDTDTVSILVGTTNGDEESSLVIFNYGPVEITIRLIDGEFPNYKEIIPQEFEYEYKITTEEFNTKLSRVGIFAQSSISQRVIMRFSKDNLTLEAEAQETGKAEENLKISTIKAPENSQLTMGFQYRFIKEIVPFFKETFIFKTKGEISPAVLMSKGDSTFIHVVMPLKL